jgi:uncharacterized protein (DUF2249 family)
MNCNSQNHLDAHLFDARGISKRFRHSAIFGAIESLEDGETMRFMNDHDPLPLLMQIQQRYGNQVVVEYVDRSGPVIINFHIHAHTPDTSSNGADEGAGSCGGSGGCGCSGGR